MKPTIETPLSERSALKTFAGALRNGVSAAAEALGLGRLVRKNPNWKVTGHAGKRGGLYRRIIGYKRTGPFYEQTGWHDGKPLMRQSHYHRFLHATKGWRVRRTSGPTVTLSNAQQPRAYGPQASGYQSAHGWVNPVRFVPGSAGQVLVPYFKKDRAKLGQQHPGMHTMERKEMFRAPLAA
jgi:hypothetical protein